MSDIVLVRSECEVAREILAGADVASLPTDYPLDRMAQDRMDEIERLRKALKLAKEWGVDSDMGGKNPVSAALRHWIKGGMRGPLTTEQTGDEG